MSIGRYRFIAALVFGVTFGNHVAYAEGLKERLARMPPPAFTSQKAAGDLEYCIGSETARWMRPNSLRGDKKVILYGTPDPNMFGLVFFAIAIEDAGPERTIAYRASPSWDGKTEKLIRSCI